MYSLQFTYRVTLDRYLEDKTETCELDVLASGRTTAEIDAIQQAEQWHGPGWEVAEMEMIGVDHWEVSLG